jgi:hypothetical protein
MAILTTNDLAAAAASAQDIIIQKASITSVANQWSSCLAAAGTPGAGSLTVGNTTSGVVPTDGLAGAPLITDATSGKTLYITGFDAINSVISQVRIYDRIFHVGSIVATTLATTTLSSPPSYASRNPSTNGLGLELWLEVNVAISATATTVTVTYTNQSGTTGRTATLDTNISGLIAGSMRPFRLQAGDTGIASIQSITVGGTVGTAGSFNVLVTRTLATHTILAPSLAEPRQDPFKVGLPIVYSASCICVMVLPQSTATGVVSIDLDIGQG